MNAARETPIIPTPPPSSGSTPSTPLNVIGLISGGKDSFFGLLHCLAQGHRIVALANLYPGEPGNHGGQDQTQIQDQGQEDEDYDSFMYQTVGHQIIPLYATATGLPLYRQKILGHAVHSGRDYHAPTPHSEAGNESTDQSEDNQPDETESMTCLLRRVRDAHPEANAVCAGALLSTYQRTRVESVAVRLGLVSLAYLWKYPLLPFGGEAATAVSSDYLSDLAAVGFDARIVKVASGGLDDTVLWTNVASVAGRARLQRALARFEQLSGSGGDGQNNVGSLLGEGGEYETLVVDGPPVLFPGGSVCVSPEDRRIVREGGGSAWLQIRRATVQPRSVEANAGGGTACVRQPDVLDRRFFSVLRSLGQQQRESQGKPEDEKSDALDEPWRGAVSSPAATRPVRLTTWCVIPECSSSSPMTIAEATRSIVDQVRRRLGSDDTSPSSPTSCSVTSRIDRTLVVLRRMADFPVFNSVYGTLFSDTPNPPARVTIACGDHMPAGVDVAVHFSVLDGESVDRHGLHVQSRSYWAPANIGPYSQAVHLPLAYLQHLSQEDAICARVENEDADADGHTQPRNGPRMVSIAGQIPLLPNTMELPSGFVEAREKDKALEDASPDAPPQPRAEGPSSFGFQTTLALQHLWRIGVEVDVQWWIGAVAYVPRQGKNETDAALPLLSLQDKAVLVAQAWHTAHTWKPEEQDQDKDDSGPDLWDLKFNAQYAGYGAASGTGDNVSATPRLPDWSVLRKGSASDNGHGARPHQLEDARAFVPPVFLAEIHELPRAAPVEWHVLAGLSHLPAGGLAIGPVATAQEGSWPTEYRTVVSLAEETTRTTRGGPPVIVQTIRTWPYPAVEANKIDTANVLWSGVLLSTAAQAPDVVYLDASIHAGGENGAAAASESGSFAALPVVPCESLWNEHGVRLAAVVVWTTVQELAE